MTYLGTQLIGICLSDLVYFFVATFLRQILYGKRDVSALTNLKVSTIGGIVNVLITCPWWTIQTKLMLQKKSKKINLNDENYKNVFDAFLRVYKEKGIKNGFYSSLTPSLWLVSNPIIQFVTYEWLISFFKHFRDVRNLNVYEYFLCGALSKAIGVYRCSYMRVRGYMCWGVDEL